MLAFLRSRLLAVDTRTLGLFRIYLGLLLLANLWDRAGGLDGVSFYSNEGLWPNHYALFLPPTRGFWSPLLGLSTPTEVRVALVLVAAVYVLFTLGWRTRLMQVLTLLCVEAVNFRFLLVQHGGNVALNLLVVWTLFLPLGDRFSLDALLRSLREHPEKGAEELAARRFDGQAPKVREGLAYLCVCFNFAAIYFFNTVHKQGSTWMDGSAVHWVLWQNRVTTSLAGWLRFHEPGFFSPALTYGTLVVEGLLPLLILSPWLKRYFRPVALLFIWTLHGSIALLCTLGPFSYAMMGFGLLLLTPELWDALERRWARAPALTVRFDPQSPRQLFAARVLARLDLGRRLTFEERPGAVLGPRELTEFLRPIPGWRWVRGVLAVPGLSPLAFALARWLSDLGAAHLLPRPPRRHPPPLSSARAWVRNGVPALVLAAVVSQLLVENWAVPPFLKPHGRPGWMAATIEYLQIPQGWSMFAPQAPLGDAMLVVDATLVDGTHVDLLTGGPPDFDAPLHGPLGLNQHWCEVHARMPGWRQHWRNFRDYLRRRPQLLGWPPEKQVVSLEVWQVQADSPPPGETTVRNLRRLRLFGEEPL